ncbi:hypothetical protein GCM10010259_18220 [Streptomyces daghestanicus]|jgi:hypothetical protein|uniref:Uncharacterized protein n=1 Tax=Streptomyces daghestanicus TaxID=66885 RepID=A0ABQ3Q3S4_9ACTN|nr:hypothetical protein GCM10010240_68770 [Streptomyces griseoviridis]GGU28027.1 hypothetical protein GCM10010259_18220 [Streptomyces daghestanicus]GHI31885.1 hypothetical protein Sdagh_36150 [Streptomyces daghestanicus]
MLAHALLAVARADEHTRPAPEALIQLTRNEIQRLFATLVVRPQPLPTTSHPPCRRAPER